jgi:hypothetical protein
MNGEPAMLPRPGTHMSEAQKVKWLRPALAAFFTPFDRKTTKLDQTRLSRMQFQAELGKPFPEILQTRFCLAVILETDHEVIRISYDYHVAVATVVPPPLDPKVEHIMLKPRKSCS